LVRSGSGAGVVICRWLRAGEDDCDVLRSSTATKQCPRGTAGESREDQKTSRQRRRRVSSGPEGRAGDSPRRPESPASAQRGRALAIPRQSAAGPSGLPAHQNLSSARPLGGIIAGNGPAPLAPSPRSGV
jgi:hypothetical protein